MALRVTVNGQAKDFAQLQAGSTLGSLVDALELKADRVAVELNGKIASRTAWSETPVQEGDRVEVVHFVGGGARAGSAITARTIHNMCYQT